MLLGPISEGYLPSVEKFSTFSGIVRASDQHALEVILQGVWSVLFEKVKQNKEKLETIADWKKTRLYDNVQCDALSWTPEEE